MKIRSLFILLFIAFVVLGIYYPSIFAPFNSVDDQKLVNNLINQEEQSLLRLFIPKSSGYYYRPLLIVTFWLDQWLWGLQESFMHLGNILLHVMNSLLVYAIVTRISPSGVAVKPIGAAAALLFALHPLNTEAVNWISGRTDLLAGFFILGSTWFLLSAMAKRNYVLLLASAVSVLVACLAKETAIFFLPAALFMIYCSMRSSKSPEVNHLKQIEIIGYFTFVSVGFSYFAIRSIAFAKGDVGVRHAATQITESSINYFHLVRVAVKIGGFYLKKLFFPWPLNFCIIKVPDYYLGLGCALILIIAYLLYRRDLVSSFFVAGICIGTSALIVAFGNLAWTPIAERYMYIPSAFMVIGTTLMIAPQRRVSKNANATISIVTLLVLVVFAISTTLRNITWQDNLTLFTDTVEKSPDFLPARNDKAIALINKGMNEEGYKIIKSLPTSAGARNWEQTESNKVSVLVSEGKIDEARKVLKPMAEKSWRNQVRSIEALLKIDENLMMDPKRKDTVEIGGEVVGLLETLQKKTGNPFYYYRLGQTYLILKNRAEAQKMFEKAYLYAPATAYYREPAGKLAKKLAELARE